MLAILVNCNESPPSFATQEALRGRRCASLRSAATPARGQEESGRSTPSAAHRASPSPADTPAPKKSNWEVIEHFSSSKTKRSPTAVST
uniref:SFRICE_039511 n=1 Tax=Spodoptera frugiperda TaxID=7108 RepID=A0A2H1WVZ2_SPOFR